jgi:hypothetical protein
VCLGLAALVVLPYIPRAHSDAALARTVVGGVDVLQGRGGEEELKRRGTAAVPEVIASLHAVPPDQVREFESGLNSGALNALRLLGELGGPEAIAELRAWFRREDAAPDIRATAARALAEAGDTSEATAIGALLENRTYEWRKGHPDLMYALGLMKAAGEVEHIRTALRVDESDGNFAITLYHAGIQACRRIDTPESRAVVEELATTGEPWLRNRVHEWSAQPL